MLAGLEARPVGDYPEANTAAVIELAAVKGEIHVIDEVSWSYSGDPTGGRLLIEDGDDTIFDLDIVADGPGRHGFRVDKESGLMGTVGKAVTITLAAGGGSVVGKLNALVR